ncbi:MAG: hypothetical protein SXA11_06595 [Cyanobacteriota bacterium]|nr:hypothetical protein [Cyanobacteriota bacterium]
METSFPLTLEDVADRLGMSARHLTNRKNGPITRVLETYYWLDLCDGDTYADAIVEKLENYLADCGKRGENHIAYEAWQEKIWQENNADSISVHASTQGLLVPCPKVEVVSADQAIKALGDSVSSFNLTTGNFDAHFDAIGEHIGNTAVTRVAVATKKTIDNGLTQLFNELSKMGGN